MMSVRMWRSFGVLAIISAGLAGVAWGQDVDPALMTYINSVKAVDNHAHVFAPDVHDDKEYDALRCDQPRLACSSPEKKMKRIVHFGLTASDFRMRAASRMASTPEPLSSAPCAKSQESKWPPSRTISSGFVPGRLATTFRSVARVVERALHVE
jgi:hypothetical protein